MLIPRWWKCLPLSPVPANIPILRKPVKSVHTGFIHARNEIVPRSLFIFWSFGLLEFLSSLIQRTVVNLCVNINDPMAVNRSATTIKPAVGHSTMFTLPNPVIDSKTPEVVLMGIMQHFRSLLSLVSGVQFKLTQWQCRGPGIVYPAFDYLDVLILFSYYTRSQHCVMLILLTVFLLSL